jgi:hypothetical protein
VTDQQAPPPRPARSTSRIPRDSVLYGRLVPILLSLLGLATAAMILFALGVFVGLIPFR